MRAAIGVAGAAAGCLLVGVPTDVVDTPLFHRMTPVRALDYAVLAATTILFGLLAATHGDGGGTRTAVGAIGSTLSMGCPVCNKAVVALAGASGASGGFARLQPLLGLFSVGLLLSALALRRRSGRSCSVPLPDG